MINLFGVIDISTKPLKFLVLTEIGQKCMNNPEFRKVVRSNTRWMDPKCFYFTNTHMTSKQSS